MRVAIDLVFLLNCTGGMRSCLSALAKSWPAVLQSMEATARGHLDWRAKVCGYWNPQVADGEWWVESPFTSDASQVQTQIAGLVAVGGNGPQPLLDGLWKLAAMPATGEDTPTDTAAWRQHCRAGRIVIVVTDSVIRTPMVVPEAAGGAVDDVASAVMLARLHLFMICPDADCYASLQQIDGSSCWLCGTTGQQVHAAFADDTRRTKLLTELGRACVLANMRGAAPVEDL